MKSEISFDCVFKWFRCTNSIKSCIQDIIYDKPICGFLSSVYHLLINSSMLMITLITIHSLFIAQIIGIKTEFMRRWIPLQLLPNIDKCSMDFYSTLIRSIKLNECYRWREQQKKSYKKIEVPKSQTSTERCIEKCFIWNNYEHSFWHSHQIINV